MVLTNAVRQLLFCLALTVAILAVGKVGSASADYFASTEAIDELTRSVRAGGCSTACKLADGTQATIAGSDVEGGIFYELTHHLNCGSAGCGKTAVLIEDDVVRLVGNAFGMDMSSVMRLALTDPKARARMPILSTSQQAEWQNKIVSGGLNGNGFAHGQFPSLGSSTHAGVDIGGRCGLPVLAAFDGAVTHVVGEGDGDFETIGNAVAIDHGLISGRPTWTIYLHMKEAPEVGLGKINQSDRIGKTGETGVTQGCHLHFEVRHFEGIRGFFSPEWRNIYGLGDRSGDASFKVNWSNPEEWVGALPSTPMSNPVETLPEQTAFDVEQLDSTVAIESEVEDEAGSRSYAPCPRTLSNSAKNPFECLCEPRQAGRVWGTDMYTSDSNVCAAAIHAGVLAAGDSGRIAVKPTVGQEQYTGSNRNGVVSSSWGRWASSFVIGQAGDSATAAVAVGPPTIEIDSPIRENQLVSMKIKGLEPNTKYWITIVPSGEKLGKYTDWKDLKNFRIAKLSLNARSSGAYEARLHSYLNGYPLIASSGFTVSSETPEPKQTPQTSQVSKTIVAAVATDDIGSVKAAFPEVFQAISDYNFPNTLNKTSAKETATEAIETLLMFSMKIQSNSSANALGYSAQDFADLFTSDPSAALGLVTDDILVDVGKGMAIKYGTDLFIEFSFSRKPLENLPSKLQAPLKALVESVISEGLGLVSANTGNPVALVGPVLNRVLDIVEIYQATKKLDRTQQVGLLAVAIGAEINAELAVKYPSEKSQRVISSWLKETEANLVDIVGADDATEAMEIVRLGYTALVEQKSGKGDEALEIVNTIQKKENEGDGPFFLSAEGPLDLLVKISAGGDAPKQAAQAIIFGTGLAQLYEPALLKDPQNEILAGWEVDPTVMTILDRLKASVKDQSQFGCESSIGPLNEQVAKSLLVNTEISIRTSASKTTKIKVGERLINSRGELCWVTQTSCFRIDYCRSGEAIFTTSRSRGKNTWYNIIGVTPLQLTRNPQEISTISPDGIQSKQLESGDGTCRLKEIWPVYTHSSHMSLPDSMRWSGACPNGFANGEGTLIWYKSGKPVFDLKIGGKWDTQLTNGKYTANFDSKSFSFLLDHCRERPIDSIAAISFRASRGINVYSLEKRPDEYFANKEIVGQLLAEALRTAVEYCPIPRIGTGGIIVKIFNQHDDRKPLVVANSKAFESESWKSVESLATKNVIENYLAIERNRVAQQQTIARERTQQKERDALEREIQSIKERGEALIESEEGTLEDLVTALQINEKSALSALENGIRLQVPPAKGIETRTFDSSRFYAVVYMPVSPITRTITTHRQTKMNQSFSWNDWFDQINSIESSQQYQITCLYPDLDDVPEETGYVTTKLKSFSTVGRKFTVVLECNFGWFD